MGGVPEKIAEFQIFTILMMSGNHLYAIILAEFVMGSWIRFWKTRNWADAISNQFSYNSLQDPRMSIFDFGKYLTISVSITQKSKYIKYSGKIRLRINFEVEHIYWLLTRSDFLRVQKQAWSSKNPFSLRNRMAVKFSMAGERHFFRFCKNEAWYNEILYHPNPWKYTKFRARSWFCVPIYQKIFILSTWNYLYRVFGP